MTALILAIALCQSPAERGTRYTWEASACPGVQILRRNGHVYGAWSEKSDTFSYRRLFGGWGPARVPPWANRKIPVPKPKPKEKP